MTDYNTDLDHAFLPTNQEHDFDYYYCRDTVASVPLDFEREDYTRGFYAEE